MPALYCILEYPETAFRILEYLLLSF